jgi:hypothetical protein
MNRTVTAITAGAGIALTSLLFPALGASAGLRPAPAAPAVRGVRVISLWVACLRGSITSAK